MDFVPLINSCWWLPLALIVVGVFVGRTLGTPRIGIFVGLGVTLVPPLAFAALYWAISQGGCSGGECGGAMLLLIPIGLIACLLGFIGAGIFIQGLWRALVAQFI
ncbi:MAG TPA: hypothetical protein VJ832_03050 [Variovorax sp.]|nr:hypothetical protein [Variovorax sp.]